MFEFHWFLGLRSIAISSHMMLMICLYWFWSYLAYVSSFGMWMAWKTCLGLGMEDGLMVGIVLRLGGCKDKLYVTFRACEDRFCICFANSLGFGLLEAHE